MRTISLVRSQDAEHVIGAGQTKFLPGNEVGMGHAPKALVAAVTIGIVDRAGAVTARVEALHVAAHSLSGPKPIDEGEHVLLTIRDPRTTDKSEVASPLCL